MGINDFWKFITVNGEPMIVGVDACLWMTQCQAVFHTPRHAQAGRNPELRALFYKLAALNQTGVIGVFVFDGPNRPSVKRGTQVKSKPHWLTQEFKQMIELFGFHSHTAPGEAEAELAHLNQEQDIHAVLTDDSDAAIFGAQCIIRSLDKKKKDKVTVYTAKALRNTASVGLTLGGMLLLAILRGGDYDAGGLVGCGMAIAHELARCGFGDTLLAAVQNQTEGSLEHFLVAWRRDLRDELASNSRGHMRSRQKALASKIPETFPSIRVLKLYVHPVTSGSDGFEAPTTDRWVPKVPSLADLALCCKRKFGWSAVDMVSKFKKYIFPGVFMRRLTLPLDVHERLHQHVILGRVNEEHPPLSAYLSVLARNELTPGVILYKLKFCVGGQVKLHMFTVNVEDEMVQKSTSKTYRKQ
ncbi:PIN domain-like protein [Mycena filopes]|nr:PIN domain-like protein [Mycena filopes]